MFTNVGFENFKRKQKRICTDIKKVQEMLFVFFFKENKSNREGGKRQYFPWVLKYVVVLATLKGEKEEEEEEEEESDLELRQPRSHHTSNTPTHTHSSLPATERECKLPTFGKPGVSTGCPIRS